MDDVARLEAWIALIREASFGSDVPKVVGILTKKALDGADPGEHGLRVLRAYRARVPQTGSGHRPEQSSAPPGSSPAGSMGASDLQTRARK